MTFQSIDQLTTVLWNTFGC